MLDIFIFIDDGKIFTCFIDESNFPKFDAAQFLLFPSKNQRDEQSLLQKLRDQNPTFLEKNERFQNSVEKVNYILLKLIKIYKKHSEPYTMSYKSSNQTCIDLKKIYQISPYRITLNSNFNESKMDEIESSSLVISLTMPHQ